MDVVSFHHIDLRHGRINGLANSGEFRVGYLGKLLGSPDSLHLTRTVASQLDDLRVKLAAYVRDSPAPVNIVRDVKPAIRFSETRTSIPGVRRMV